MDPAFKSALVAALDRGLQRALAYDPGTQSAIIGLAGQTLALNVATPPFFLYCLFSEDGCRLVSYYDGPVDCELTGSATALISLLWREHHTLANTGVDITGNVSLLQRLQKILVNLELDWEQILQDALSQTAGSQAAEWLSLPLIQLIRKTTEKARHHTRITPDWWHDYLTEEVRLLPSPHEIQAFASQVDDLRAATERLSARLRKLQLQLDSQDSSQS